MKIVFICGSLEPGRDGVGDYVYRLATELMQQEHQAIGIAINDHHVSQETLSNSQQVNGKAFSIIRLPSIWPANKRFSLARQWIDQFDPDWLSLQFVPFSFHSKGIPYDLDKRLLKLGRGYKWHLMVHELWVGMDQKALIKHVWWGKAQRYIIGRIISRIQPTVIHTQTHLYQLQLRRIGFKSNYLPLFSNIPNVNIKLDKNTNKKNKAEVLIKESIRLIVFGTIHSGAPIQQLALEAAEYARIHESSVTLVFIGNCGKEQECWAGTWKSVGLPVEVLGYQTPANVSSIMLSASHGIATTPELLVEKSGSVAAMHEHGLPVICVAAPWHPKGVLRSDVVLPEGITVYKKGVFERCINFKNTSVFANTASRIASHFITDLLLPFA